MVLSTAAHGMRQRLPPRGADVERLSVLLLPNEDRDGYEERWIKRSGVTADASEATPMTCDATAPATLDDFLRLIDRCATAAGGADWPRLALTGRPRSCWWRRGSCPGGARGAARR